MRILFVGMGSAARRHLAVLRRYHAREHALYAFRRIDSPINHPGGVVPLYQWADIKRVRPQIAMICNPTNLHIPTAIDCARQGMHLFIEKPLSVTTDGLDELLKIVERKKLTAYVAYPFRHSIYLPSLRAHTAGKDFARIVCQTDVTKWGKPYSRSAATGGGAVLELSHEIDLAAALFGPVQEIKIEPGWEPNEFTSAITCAKVTTAHRYARCEILLDLLSKKEERYVEAEICGAWMRMGYSATDQMYVDQLRYFFDNIGNPSIVNGIDEAAELFRHIAEGWTHEQKFRDYCLRTGRQQGVPGKAHPYL